MNNNIIHIFLDTNIFLHCQDIENVDWKTLAGSQHVLLVLAPTVVDELDDKKNDSNRKIAEKAKKALAKFRVAHINPDSIKVKLHFVVDRAEEETLKTHRLKSSSQDDCILAAIIEYKAKMDKDDGLIFYTNDTGPIIKSKSLGIDAQLIPEKYLLPNELDETQKENQALRQQLNEYKNAQPNLKLVFNNGNTLLKVAKRPEHTEQEFADFLIAEQKKKMRPMTYLKPFGPSHKPPSELQVMNYNQNLETYFDELKVFAKYEYERQKYAVESFEMGFIVDNSGSSPAMGIDIEIDFECDLKISKTYEGPAEVYWPSEPIRPTTSEHDFDLKFNARPYSISEKFNMPWQNVPVIGELFGKPTIKADNGHWKISYHLPKVKHHQKEKLDKIFLKFENKPSLKGFKISYEMTVDNIPKPVVGNLNVKFENSKVVSRKE